MRSLFAKYRQRLQHQHGWEVEVTCPHCGVTAVPVFNGWNPSYAVNYGKKPTIYSNLNCSKCGVGLKDAAGSKLVELFSEVRIPKRNRYLLTGAAAFAVVMVVAGLIALLGVSFAPALVTPAITVVVFTAVLMRVYFFWFNWQITSLRHECECGNPAYKFMGLLGRSYCYRCSSCSKLLRLRD
jgi:hypothetical protein